MTLGLISVISCTIAIWILGLNFFDMAPSPLKIFAVRWPGVHAMDQDVGERAWLAQVGLRCIEPWALGSVGRFHKFRAEVHSSYPGIGEDHPRGVSWARGEDGIPGGAWDVLDANADGYAVQLPVK